MYLANERTAQEFGFVQGPVSLCVRQSGSLPATRAAASAGFGALPMDSVGQHGGSGGWIPIQLCRAFSFSANSSNDSAHAGNLVWGWVAPAP